ncbi:MAG: hypothetical protein JNL77_03210 [Nitrosomonas sp.]|nr:hypothetical protein [Nitrosomonas sp.]
MSEKIEIAKIASQLTIAMLENKDGHFEKIAKRARSTAEPGEKIPDVFAVFDVVYKHVQSTLKT